MKVLIAFLFAIVCMVNAQGDHHHHHHLEEYKDYQSHPHYNFHYGVHDPHHHDQHEQWEARDGHKTKGSYSLQQPDGRKRIVEYEADKHGIHYNVKFEGHAIHEPGHGGHHGKAVSKQYHHGVSNFAGHLEHHHGGEGGHHHGGSGGSGGGDSHGHGTSYSTHVQHAHGHHHHE